MATAEEIRDRAVRSRDELVRFGEFRAQESGDSVYGLFPDPFPEVFGIEQGSTYDAFADFGEGIVVLVAKDGDDS